MTKQGLKFLSDNGDVCLVLYLILVLLLAEWSGVFQEGSRKQNLVQSRGSGGGKVVFALLEEIVALHMGLTPVNF